MAATVILVRHAKPIPEGGDPPLSDEGKEIQAQMSVLLADEGYQADLILHSLRIRARQTAEILTRFLGGKLVESEALGEFFDPDVILSQLHAGTTVLVGHEPTLPALVRQLTGQDVLPAGMSKSSAAIVTFTDTPAWGGGELIAYKQP